MRRQMVGIAFILVGILFTIPNKIFDAWVPIIDTFPWGPLGLILGVLGLVYVIINAKNPTDNSEDDSDLDTKE